MLILWLVIAFVIGAVVGYSIDEHINAVADDDNECPYEIEMPEDK